MKFVYIHGGTTQISDDKGRLSMSRGDLAFLPANVSYAGLPTRSVETITLYIDTQFVFDQLKWLPQSAELFEEITSSTTPRILALDPQSNSRMRSLVRHMACSRDTGPSSELRLLSDTAEFLEAILPTHESQLQHSRSLNQHVENAKAVLSSDLSRAWSISELAKAVSISPSHLARLFSRELGISPSRYLNEQRAQRMNELILQDGYRVSEAGRAVGWPDPSHASRAYTRVFGTAPTKMKNDTANKASNLRNNQQAERSPR